MTPPLQKYIYILKYIHVVAPKAVGKVRRFRGEKAGQVTPLKIRDFPT